MSRYSTFFDEPRAVPFRRLRLAACAAGYILALLLIGCAEANGQEPDASALGQSIAPPPAFDSSSSSTATPDESDNPSAVRGSVARAGGVAPQSALSADQIISILQQDPDLLMEVKSELAERMQEQGVQSDPDEISDQALYNQISASPSLRLNLTAVLRARGYASDDDLQSIGSNTSDESALGLSYLERQSQPSADGAAGMRLEEDANIGAATSGTAADGLSATSASSTRRNRNQQLAMNNPRTGETAHASTDPPAVLRQPTPFDLQSMRDLYTQLPSDTARLPRFGSDVFVNRRVSANPAGLSGRSTPLDVPLGPDYIVGAGDKLTIELWGGITQSITRTIDRDGRIFLPDAGAAQIAGLSLEQAESVIEGLLKPQYRNAKIAVTVSGLRSVRVYVVGDVQRPGGYDISSLATPLSALYAAGGPTAVGSLRTLLHYRGKQLIEEVDLYDFLLHGIRNGSAIFESGDTLLAPPAGTQVAVYGAVKRPAIYELKPGEATLATVLDDAGGLTAAASLDHIRIERIDANRQRETVTLPRGAGDNAEADHDVLAAFPVRDGDRIRIEPILPYSQRAVYLAGHVVRPGRLAYSDGMKLGDVLRSYQDMLPEPAAHGEIVRLVPPDLHAETIDFNLPDVLIGNANVDLQPFDTVRIFGRYQADAPMVTIRGEVLRPGKYPMSQGMTTAQLVRMAGGFKRDALRKSADLTSYNVVNGSQVVEKLATVKIGAAVTGTDPTADIPLKPGDILAIHQITDWVNIGESVTIDGQVRFPGSYGFQDGERLSSVLRRAGGLLPAAYPMGAVLVRTQVKDLEQTSRDELVRQIEANSAAARLSPNLSESNSAGALELIKSQQDQVLADLRSHPPTGRMVIQVTADIDSWANTTADIELHPGDLLTIPKQPGFVLVTGQVYNATALTFTPGKTAAWYLSHAGGTNASANRKDIFIIRANGSVVGRRSGGWFEGDVLSTRLNQGDVVVVPQKIIGGSLFWRNLLTAGQLAASTAFTAGVAVATL
jgi:protein involved in polysaccharide export with SLBB domain